MGKFTGPNLRHCPTRRAVHRASRHAEPAAQLADRHLNPFFRQSLPNRDSSFSSRDCNCFLARSSSIASPIRLLDPLAGAHAPHARPPAWLAGCFPYPAWYPPPRSQSTQAAGRTEDSPPAPSSSPAESPAPAPTCVGPSIVGFSLPSPGSFVINW